MKTAPANVSATKRPWRHPDDEKTTEGTTMTKACDGHPAGAFDPMGATVYCDGSCKPKSTTHFHVLTRPPGSRSPSS